MAMTSVTRSTRSAENHLVHTHSRTHHQAVAHARRNVLDRHPSPARTKRHRESPERDFDAFKPKKPRLRGITVEIPAGSSLQSKIAVESVESANPIPQPIPPKPAAALGPVPTPSQEAPPTVASDTPTPTAATTFDRQPPNLKKQHGKVANGLKQELNRLKVVQLNTQNEGRKLRSQEATRFKSELSAYFPDYDEVIGNDPKEQHVLNLDTPIIIFDSNSSAIGYTPVHSGAEASNRQPHRQNAYPVRGYGDALFADLFDSQRIDFGFLETQYKGKPLRDPLPDAAFEAAHKRAERLERSIRNSEKGRAQHEKDQIMRLLDGLQGHDWLRVMGVSGVTESKKRTFEPAREHFIKGCQGILDKFRSWAVGEKRRKLEKERAMAEAEREEDGVVDEHDDGNQDVEEASGIETSQPEGDGMHSDGSGDAHKYGDPPDYSDADASIAKQLQEEALAAAKTTSRRARGGVHPLQRLRAPPGPEPKKEFTSFFKKKYQRDAALDKKRRRGRTMMAWGCPVPEFGERDFDLPEEYRDGDTLKAHERKRRRDKRNKR